MLTQDQRDFVDIVLVSPRNPLNIGAAARAMANFGFSNLTVAAPYAPHWREAKSAVGASDVLRSAKTAESLAEAIACCTFVLGTGTLTRRKPRQPVVTLPALGPLLQRELDRGGRAALVFGQEKRGLTRKDLSFCRVLVEIPTDPRQPSMNLGQAVAVCLYELARTQATAPEISAQAGPDRSSEGQQSDGRDFGEAISSAGLVSSSELEYSSRTMQSANRRDLKRLSALVEETMIDADRLLLRKLSLSARETQRILGIFRGILWRLHHARLPRR